MTWKREGWHQKSKTFGSEAKARDKVGVLTSDEPWRFFGDIVERERTGDSEIWCESLDRMITLREDARRRREMYPPIEWVTIKRRSVTRTPWEVDDALQIADVSPQQIAGQPLLTQAQIAAAWADLEKSQAELISAQIEMSLPELVVLPASTAGRTPGSTVFTFGTDDDF